MPRFYKPRISIETTEEVYNRFVQLIPWGLRSRVLFILLDDLLDLVEENGDLALNAIVNRAIKVEHVVQGLPSRAEGE